VSALSDRCQEAGYQGGALHILFGTIHLFQVKSRSIAKVYPLMGTAAAVRRAAPAADLPGRQRVRNPASVSNQRRHTTCGHGGHYATIRSE
jgi:hypothetical protein